MLYYISGFSGKNSEIMVFTFTFLVSDIFSAYFLENFQLFNYCCSLIIKLSHFNCNSKIPSMISSSSLHSFMPSLHSIHMQDIVETWMSSSIITLTRWMKSFFFYSKSQQALMRELMQIWNSWRLLCQLLKIFPNIFFH